MRALVLIPILASVASAQPESSCQVSIVRAPEAVKATVEQWLAQERCTVALTVRIIPTENNGLYVLATDQTGRVRERIVPDAQSAGVLVASWAADDGIAPSLAPPTAPSSGPTAYGGEFHPPGQTEPEDDYPVVEKRLVYPTKFITFGGGIGANESDGFHADVDLLSSGSNAFGLFAGASLSTINVTDYLGYGYNSRVADYTIGVKAQHTWRWADWNMRGYVGAGLDISEMSLSPESYNPYGNTSAGGTGNVASPYGEVALLFGRALGESKAWAIEGGALASYTHQNWELADTMQTLVRDAGNVMVVLGVRHGL